MKRKHLIIIFAVGIFFIAGFLLGGSNKKKANEFNRGNKITVSGQLKNSKKELLKKKEIVITNKTESITVTTDNLGYFHTHLEKDSEYTLKTSELTGKITAKNDSKVNIAMTNGELNLGKVIETDSSVTVLQNKAIELDNKNFIYEVAPDLSNVTLYAGKKKQEKIDLLIGDVIAIPASPEYISGLGLTITAITKKDGNYLLSTKQAEFKDIVKSFDTKKNGHVTDIKEAPIEVADDIDFIDAQNQAVAWVPPEINSTTKLTFDKTFKYPSKKETEKKKEKTHLDPPSKEEKKKAAKIALELKAGLEGNIKLDVHLDTGNLSKMTTLATANLDFKANFKLDGSAEATQTKYIFKVLVPSVSPYVGVSIPVYLKYDTSGKVSVTYDLNVPFDDVAFGIKDGKLINESTNKFAEGLKKANKQKEVKPEDFYTEDTKTTTNFKVKAGPMIGVCLTGLTFVDIIELDAFVGPSEELQIKAEKGTTLIDNQLALINISIEVDPKILKPLIKLFPDSLNTEGNINLLSTELLKNQSMWLLGGNYSELLTIMDEAEKIAQNPDFNQATDYQKLLDLIDGNAPENKEFSFSEIRKRSSDTLFSVKIVNHSTKLFTSQKEIDAFKQVIEETIKSVKKEKKETSKFDSLPQSTQFVVIQSLKDDRILYSESGPEFFQESTIRYFEDTKRMQFMIHSGAGVGHPAISWILNQDTVTFIDSIRRTSFDEYTKEIPINDASATVSKKDLYDLYIRLQPQYDKWAAGITVKNIPNDDFSNKNVPEGIEERTTEEKIALPKPSSLSLKGRT